MAITALPTPPLPTDTTADFNTKAFALLNALPTFVTETNAVETAVDADAATATTQAGIATTKSGEALTSANNAASSASLADDWANKTDGAVSGGEFSAKYYALVAQAAVGALPDGTINDTITTLVDTWSSSKISTELAGKASTASVAAKAGGNATDNIGYLNIPLAPASANTTITKAHAGGGLKHPTSDTTARVFTIDSNANQSWQDGTAITIWNQNAAGVVTLSVTTDTMRLAGAGTTGSRTLAANSIATVIWDTTTATWGISGTGVT